MKLWSDLCCVGLLLIVVTRVVLFVKACNLVFSRNEFDKLGKLAKYCSNFYTKVSQGSKEFQTEMEFLNLNFDTFRGFLIFAEFGK